MENNDKIATSIKDLVQKYVSRGLEDTTPEQEWAPLWYRSFGYHQDPLALLDPEHPYQDTDLKLFVNRSSEVKVLSNYIGKANHLAHNLHFAIIGSQGIGKHTTLKIILKIVKTAFPDITIEFYSHKYQFNFKTNDSMSKEGMMKLDNTPLDVRIISCAGKNPWLFLKRIAEFRENTHLTLSIWNTSELPLQEAISENRRVFFRNYSRNDITSIFQHRIKYSHSRSEPYFQYYNDLMEYTIPAIAESFQGNLYICFQIFRELHHHAKILSHKVLPHKLVDRVIQKYLTLKAQPITSREEEIIHYFLHADNMQFLTTSHLRDDMGFDRTVAWRYLEQLCKKQVFQRVKYGNPSRYTLNDIFKSFYEDGLKKKVIFEE
jgi:hypothetical protein